MPKAVNNLVVVSDLHCGCRLGLCPPDGIPLDDGGTYRASAFQRKIWRYWQSFWDDFVPDATRGESYAVVLNGDMVEGVHHHAVTQISHNLEDQFEIARRCLEPRVSGPKVEGFYMVRGTEAHVATSAREEERLGKVLGAIPNAEGQRARWDLWKQIGPNRLVHFLHHIGTTGSQAYESTAVHKELIESFVEAGRWNRKPPDIIVRSHRHRYIEDTIATGSERGETCRATAVVTPAWQGKTPFAWKIPGGRLSTPQFGGIVIRYAKGELFVRARVWTVDRSPVE